MRQEASDEAEYPHLEEDSQPREPQPSDILTMQIERREAEGLIWQLESAASILRFLAPSANGADFGSRLRDRANSLREWLATQ